MSKPFGGDFVAHDQTVSDAPDFLNSNDDLATKEEGSRQRCQVCDFPATAGHVQGEIDGARYSLLICQSCLQHAVLCLRDSHRQCRLFSDDFEIEELCSFGKEREMIKQEQRRIMRLKEVMHVSGLGRSSIYNYIAAGKFPRSRPLGGRMVGWDSIEVQGWVDAVLEGREWRPLEPDASSQK